MPDLQLFVFGPPRLERAGQLVDLGLRKALALLVYLAVRRHPHSREALATMFWPDHGQSEGRARLRHALHRLTQALPDCLAVDPSTIQMHPQTSIWLDSDEYGEHVAAGLAPASSEDVPTSEHIAHVEAAAALYRDDFLAGFTLPDAPDFDEWQFFERERLRRQLAQVLIYLMQSYTERVVYESALTYARRWLALDPLHEPAHQALMQLYAWSGQSAAAARQYQECERILGDELGVAPDKATTQLYVAIKARQLVAPAPIAERQLALGQPPSAAGQAAQAAPPPAPADHSEPPQPLTPLIGRDAEVAAVCDFLTQRRARLLTLTGPGGVGKTRLAWQVARTLEGQFLDGVALVNLAPIRDADMVLPALAYALGMREGGEVSLLARLQVYLRNKRLLLLLDNFEQVVDAAPQLTALLSGTLHLMVLVTSRVALQVTGEQEYPVEPLLLPDISDDRSWEHLLRSPAIRLFVERMQAVRPDYALVDANATAVAAICRRLDGLPLAIELAAARMRVLTPQVLLERIERRLPLLTNPSRDVPDRHRTLRDTIAWSYDLLDQAAQRLFRRLAVFVGGCSLQAAETVCQLGDGVDILEGVTILVNSSLLRQEEIGSQPRFTMLETIREYALERLAESGDLETARRQHATYYADTIIHEAGVNVYSSEATLWLDWFEREHDNIRATMVWSQATPEGQALGPALIGSLLWFWYRRGYVSEGRRFSERVLASPIAAGATAERALALHGNGLLAMWQGDLHTAIAQAEERLELVRRLEDELGIVTALMNLGTMLVNVGDDAAAEALLKEAQALCQNMGHDYFYAITIVHLGNASLGLGNIAEARDWLERATAMSRDIGENWLLAFAVNNLGEVARVQGDYEQARAHYEESEALLRAAGDKGDLARLIHSLGSVTLHEGEYARAEALFRESLALFRKLGNQRGIAECVAGFAALRMAQGHAQWSAMLLGAAQAMLSATGAAWWPADRVEYEDSLATTRAALPENAFVAAWAKGQSMSVEQAIQSCMPT